MKLPILIFLLPLAGAGWCRAQSPSAVLTELETRYAGDRAAALRRVLARYADELETLQKKLLEGGDAAGAARVQAERDRILPALGLPAVAEEDADEFAAFEETPLAPVPLPAVPAAAPADLDAILKTLLPPVPAAAGPGGAEVRSLPGSAGTARTGRRLLKMANAQLQAGYDPIYGYAYWLPGRSAGWTLNDLPPGTYKLQLRYTCDEKQGGGRLRAKFGAAELEADVPPTGTWKRKRDLEIGPFVITEPRADLILQPVSITPGAFYLMDLAAVLVLPVAAKPSP